MARGENLSAIAARYGISLSALVQANGITNPNLVTVGQVLIIPASTRGATLPVSTPTVSPGTQATRLPGNVATPTPLTSYMPRLQNAPAVEPSTNDLVYTVYPGESLSLIAARYSTTVAAIAARNRLSYYTIYAGQRLIIPAALQPASAASVTQPRLLPSATASPSVSVSGSVRDRVPTQTSVAPGLFLLPTAAVTPTPSPR